MQGSTQLHNCLSPAVGTKLFTHKMIQLNLYMIYRQVNRFDPKMINKLDMNLRLNVEIEIKQ